MELFVLLSANLLLLFFIVDNKIKRKFKYYLYIFHYIIFKLYLYNKYFLIKHTSKLSLLSRVLEVEMKYIYRHALLKY